MPAPQLSLVADIGASRAADRESRTDRFGLLGAIWHVGEDVDASPAVHTLSAGLTVRW